MTNIVKKAIITIFIIILMTVFLLSCEDAHYIELETTEVKIAETNMFEYTLSDDRPVEFNAIRGSENIKYYNSFLYFKKPNPTILKPVLLRYNLKTGNLTYVCSDPLCSHDTPDCPLYGIIASYYIYDNKIFFRQSYTYHHLKPNGTSDYIEKYMGFSSYDLSNAKLTVYEQQSIINPTTSINLNEYAIQLYAGKYRYYYDYIYNDKLEKHVYSICRMNLDTKEIVVFDSESNTSSNLNVAFLFCLDNRIYFSDLKSVYSTDYDLKDKKTVAEGKFPDQMLTDGSRIFWEEKIEDGSRSLYSMNIDGSGQTALNVNTWAWKLTSNYIYYIINDKITVGKLQSNSISSSDLVLTGSELRRCKHDGSGDELVWKFEGEYANMRFIEWYAVGNYIYASYTNWTDSDGDSIFTDSDRYQSIDAKNYNIMRINISDGDVQYIYPPD